MDGPMGVALLAHGSGATGPEPGTAAGLLVLGLGALALLGASILLPAWSGGVGQRWPSLLAGGVLLLIWGTDLLPEALSGGAAPWTVGASLAVALATAWLVRDLRCCRADPTFVEVIPGSGSESLVAARAGTAGVLALALHGLVEGSALGVASAPSAVAGAGLVAVVLLHKAGEGAVLAGLVAARRARVKLALVVGLSPMVGFLAAGRLTPGARRELALLMLVTGITLGLGAALTIRAVAPLVATSATRREQPATQPVLSHAHVVPALPPSGPRR